MIDTNVEKVRQQLYQRSQVGIQKYGCTTCTNSLDMLQWLQHLQEELMDACIYIEAVKQSRLTEYDFI